MEAEPQEAFFGAEEASTASVAEDRTPSRTAQCLQPRMDVDSTGIFMLDPGSSGCRSPYRGIKASIVLLVTLTGC